MDERFDPRKALEATGRYLTLSRGRFGREDLSIAAYHMGIGNLESVIRDFGAPRSYAEIYFGTGPTRHAAAWRRLYALGDDSSTYLWRVYAARDIMRAYRDDPDALGRAADLYTAKNSAEEVLHPEDATEVFDDPDELEAAYRDGDIRSFPKLRAGSACAATAAWASWPSAWSASPASTAACVRRRTRSRPTWRGSPARRAAARRRSTVTSTVRDGEYQDVLSGRNPEATTAYSLHTTGFAFDVARAYASPAQARAFQFVLDRLQSLNLIAWVREPGAIHVTASGEAARLTKLLREP